MASKKDIKKLSATELKVQLTQSKEYYYKLQLAHRVNPIENPIQLRKLRRDIARLNTELTNNN